MQETSFVWCVGYHGIRPASPCETDADTGTSLPSTRCNLLCPCLNESAVTHIPINSDKHSHTYAHFPMPTFPSRPLNKSPLYRRLKRHPALFGVPFLLVMVGASFGLQTFTQTRYDLHNQKVTQVRARSPLALFLSKRVFQLTHSFFFPFVPLTLVPPPLWTS
jgi:Cytochrome c oxidase assembly protein COX16